MDYRMKRLLCEIYFYGLNMLLGVNEGLLLKFIFKNI